MGIADKVHLCRKHGLTRRFIHNYRTLSDITKLIVKVFQTWGKNEAIKYLNEYNCTFNPKNGGKFVTKSTWLKP